MSKELMGMVVPDQLQSEETTNVLEKIFKVMESIEAVVKDGENDFDNYSYVTYEGLADAIRNKLVEHRLLALPSYFFLKHQEGQTATGKQSILATVSGYVRFCDPDSGEYIISFGTGDGADRSDKGVYKGITGMTKYILKNNFCLPSDDDPEGSNDDGKKAKGRKKSSGPRGGEKKLKDGDYKVVIASQKSVAKGTGWELIEYTCADGATFTCIDKVTKGVLDEAGDAEVWVKIETNDKGKTGATKAQLA